LPRLVRTHHPSETLWPDGGYNPRVREGDPPVLICAARRAQAFGYTSSIFPTPNSPHNYPQHLGRHHRVERCFHANSMLTPSHGRSGLSLILSSGPPLFILFCLTVLPFNAFPLFLAVYFGKRFLTRSLWPRRPPDQHTFPVHISDLFWFSLSLVVLPYILYGLAFLLDASALFILRLSNRVPHSNAAVAIALECSMIGFQWIQGRYVQIPPSEFWLTI